MVTKLPAEVRPLFQQAAATQGIFQVRINLDFLGELECLDLDESCRDSLHVALGVAEGDSARSYRVLVPVGVDAGVDDTAEQVVEDVGQTLGVEHSVQGAHEHGLLRVESLAGTPDVVAVCQDPRDYLHLLASHPATEIIRATSNLNT